MTTVTVNTHTYSDDGSTPNDMQNGGFRDHLLPMVSDTMVDVSAKVAAAADQVALANAAASAAAVSASTAVSGPGSNGTSTNTLTVALGVQSLSIQTGKTLSPGMPCTIASTASPRNWMNGSIDSYNSGTGALQVFVTNIGLVTPGVYPTLSAWTISLSGPAAQTGVLNEQMGSAIASAATINLNPVTGNSMHLTGGVNVTAVTLAQGAERELILDGAPLFTHGASLLLPTLAPIQGAAGDVVTFRGESGGVVRVTNWERASGRALVATVPGMVLLAGPLTPAAAGYLDLFGIFNSTYDNYQIIATGLYPSAYDSLQYQIANAGGIDPGANIVQVGPNGSSSSTVNNGYITNQRPGGMGCNFEITLRNVNSAATRKGISTEAVGEIPTGAVGSTCFFASYVGAAITGLRLFWNSGANFAAAGQIYVYGYSKI